MKCPIGVEFELLAPVGSSRLDLAERIASEHDGSVSMFWHPQVEPSMVPEMQVFHNLTPGFRVVDGMGELVATCVGDLTITQELDRNHVSQEGWFRVLSDDLRLLHLIAKHAGVSRHSLREVLQPIADLFGTELVLLDEVVRVEGAYRHPVALGSGLPGERERVTEVVSGVLRNNVEQRLEALLRPAREMGFTIPVQAATHIHFDGGAVANPRAFANLAELLHRYRLPLRFLFRTNPHCVRLGPWSEGLLSFLRSSEYRHLNWEEAQHCLREVGLTKFCDCNLRNVVFDVPEKHTVEIRILPGLIEAEPVLVAAQIVECILNKSVESDWIEPCKALAGNASSVQQMYTEIGWSRADTERVFGH